ncbi:MAG: hypothetical protein Q8L86_21285 [Vicinamibacterales bacterium]|nr:hypothetical protein [Vicinamibacterales bacterium]
MRIRLLAAVLALLMAPTPAAAWSFEAHRFIVDRAIALLPPALKPFFESRRAFIVERSVDPDLWRTAGFLAEPPNHFLDMDWEGYGPYPFDALPRDYDRAVAKFGKETVDRYGTLPWRTAEFHGELTRAFASVAEAPYALDNIAFYSAVLAHYVSDAHVPFHAVLNYDGQLTNQRGVHSRFESQLFERERPRLTIAPAAPVAVTNARDAIFETLLVGVTLTDGVLAADKAAVAGREFYDDGYFEAFKAGAGPILERRVNESISAVAAFIIGAWEAAGRPEVPLETPRRPRRIPRPPQP